MHSRAPDHLELAFFLIGQAKVGAGGTAQDEYVITPVHEVVRVDDIVRERSHVPVHALRFPGRSPERRAYSPVLHQSSLPAETTIPWWHNHRLRFQFSKD
jgi:hypothetical protein